ncbi:MAG: aspartate--tRNA ligase [Thermodesulfobacteriota bacterium]
MESLGNWKRSCYSGEVSTEMVGTEVTLMGWVQRRRDHGGLIFVDLRDREGLVQLVLSPDDDREVHKKAHSVRSEYVVAVKGEVARRPVETENPELKTGGVEVRVSELKILNDSEVPPFLIEDETDAGEDIRLSHRYLDLRRPVLQQNLVLRHRVCASARNYLSDNGFLEIETPVLTKSTPEGARDFLVPSRLNPGHFYALPQSPQLFKQILMVSGFDRYFQIVKCFRDEDLRADRQPEFTQIDAEMSFVERDDVMECMEGLIARIFRDVNGVELETPFKRLTYDEAVARYGLDAPDVRFGLELEDLTDIVRDSGFKVFANVAAKGGVVKGLNAKGCEGFTRKELDELTELAGVFGGKGLAWVKITEEGWQSPIEKFLSDEEKKKIEEAVGAEKGDLLLFSADRATVANTVLGRLRLELGRRLGIIPAEGFSIVWVTDFPMFEYDETEKRYYAMHHPFTSPMSAGGEGDEGGEESIEALGKEPGKARAKAYDMVLNGVEIGGGSIRIHDRKMQAKIFELLGMGEEEAREKFGFFLDALSFGTPPHGGIAFGLDRLVAVMAGCESIRDVIAFPKTQKALCPMSEAPSTVDKKQLEDLSLRVTKKN